jgi:hypothetical protein
MRVRCFVATLAILFGFGTAHASPKGDVQTKIKEAMENYDLMDYDAAKKLLTQALAIAKKAKLDKDPLTAKAYIDLGIVQFVNQDPDGAKLSFLSAVQIDPKIQIEPAYKSAEMGKLLESVRAEATGGGGDKTPAEPAVADSGVDCAAVQGMQHTIIDEAKSNAPVQIEAFVAPEITTSKVVVMYRPEGATEFTEVKLRKEGDCKYTGSIPTSALKGSLLHYYVAAFADGPKPVASKGSSGSPNIIEVTAAAGGGAVTSGDNEDPLNGSKGGGGGGGVDASVSSGVTVTGPKKAHLLIGLAGGTGFGYVTGTTEGMNTVKNCCIGSSLVVLQPEIGFFVNPKMSVGIAGRIGMPIGANVEGHATAAPGVLARVRLSLADNGDGIRVMGQIGAGILRNTIKLDNSMPGMDTDVVAQGPLLVGGGIGYAKHLSSSLAFTADLSVLAGIAVTDHLGSAPKLNNGAGADLSIGFQLGL